MSRLSDIESRVTEKYIKYRSLQDSLARNATSLEESKHELESYKSYYDLLTRAKPVLDDIVDRFSETAIRRLENLLCLGVKKIFSDRDYAIKIKVSDKRNNRCAELFLLENENEFPLKDSMVGGGVLVVVGFLIQCFYVSNLPVQKTVFLDEAFTQISDEYLDTFMQFIKGLANRIGLSVILITHDKRFVEFGDRVYTVNKGVYHLDKDK